MSHAELPPLPAESEFSVVSRRYGSLARRERWSAFGLAAAASLAVAGAFVVAGAWPVLPYSALELALLAAAFAWVERRGNEWERVVVAGDKVIVERAARGRLERREYNRWWLRVELDDASARAPRLRLRYAGEATVFGSALPPARRAEVAKALRRLTVQGRWPGTPGGTRT
jgi:uncharacterized membrane protein